jgi:hypothetical protein
MLNVLQIAPVGQTSSRAVAVVTDASGLMDGAQVGNWLILLGRNETVSQTIRYSAIGASEHLLTDLSRSTNYRLVTSNGSGATVRTVTVTTDTAGSLRFSAQAGEETFVLTPVSAAPTPPAPPGRVLVTR